MTIPASYSTAFPTKWQHFVIDNMAGAEVYNRSYYIEGGEPLVISGLGELPAGVNTLSVTTSDGTYTRKLLKK